MRDKRDKLIDSFMKTKKQNIRVRQKELANGNKSLFLDIYWNGKRTKEYLKLYLVKPKSASDKNNNKKTLTLAENIRAKRQTELQNDNWGFANDFKQDTNFIEYFKLLTEKRKESTGNYGNWDSTLKHLIRFCDENTTFRDVDIDFVERFKDYLQNTARTKSNNPLSQNSQNSYFNKFRACINQAFEDRIIPDNPVRRVKAIKAGEPKREYLTLSELKELVKVDCRYPMLKNTFLFSCITGMRWSDINKMVWSEVRKQGEGYRIVFKQKKTGGQEYLDINQQARDYLGEEGNPEDRVFKGLKYSAWHNIELNKWMMKAGITKDITFHCARHTFAVLQLEFGTGIYTVSKLLGHKEIKTTQIYAKIMETKKKEAMNKVPNINI